MGLAIPLAVSLCEREGFGDRLGSQGTGAHTELEYTYSVSQNLNAKRHPHTSLMTRFPTERLGKCMHGAHAGGESKATSHLNRRKVIINFIAK